MKVLLVEDDDTIRKVTHRYLLNLGCTVDLFVSGESALNADFNTYQIMFINIMLPGMNGFELLKEIKKCMQHKKENLRIPIIAHTAYGNEIRSKCLEEGFDYVIVKPSRQKDFEEVIYGLTGD